jgi:hypothetical protein
MDIKTLQDRSNFSRLPQTFKIAFEKVIDQQRQLQKSKFENPKDHEGSLKGVQIALEAVSTTLKKIR